MKRLFVSVLTISFFILNLTGLSMAIPINHPPVADANGPYEIMWGNDFTVDGSASYDPDEMDGDAIISWEWDIDYDGIFDDCLGETCTVPWGSPFSSMSIGESTFISLQVSDSWGGVAIDNAIVTIVEPIPEPATMLLLGTGLVGVAGAARRRKKNQA